MAEPSGSPDWSNLPRDLLLTFLSRLDAPSALAFAGVCAAWRAAVASAAGVPFARTPWLFSWDPDGIDTLGGPTSATLRCLLGAGNTFPTAPFPRGRSLRCCGASHGWIFASDERSNLVLYNPFARPSAANFIPLPPVTDFECVIPCYSDDDGGIVAYVHDDHCGWDADSFGSCFYQKAILSCAPSSTGVGNAAYTVAMIHCHRRSLSFANAGDHEWDQSWTMGEESRYEVPIRIFEDGRHFTSPNRRRWSSLKPSQSSSPSSTLLWIKEMETVHVMLSAFIQTYCCIAAHKFCFTSARTTWDAFC